MATQNKVPLRPSQVFLDTIADNTKILPASDEARNAIAGRLTELGYVFMPVGPGHYVRRDIRLTLKIMKDNPTRLGEWEARAETP